MRNYGEIGIDPLLRFFMLLFNHLESPRSRWGLAGVS